MIKRAKRARYESVLSSLDQRTCFRVVNTLLKPPGIIISQSSNTETVCNETMDGVAHVEIKRFKIRMMIFTSKHHLKKYTGCSLKIGDDPVSPSDRIRNLGVHMVQHLSMTDHVTVVCAAYNYHLYRLSSIRHYLTTEAAKSAVNALVT